jgi:hypothetical protein
MHSKGIYVIGIEWIQTLLRGLKGVSGNVPQLPLIPLGEHHHPAGDRAPVASRPYAAEDCSAEFKQFYVDVAKEDPGLGQRSSGPSRQRARKGFSWSSNDSLSSDRLRTEPCLSTNRGPDIQIKTLDLDTEMLEGKAGPGPVPPVCSRHIRGLVHPRGAPGQRHDR